MFKINQVDQLPMNVLAVACAHRGDRLHLRTFAASLERMNGVGIIEA
jgi:hypothetical protein